MIDELVWATSKLVTFPSRRWVWESRRPSASPRQRGETTVPTNRGKAQLPRTRPVGLEICHLVSCERSLCAQHWRPARCETFWTVLEESPLWHSRDSLSVIPDLECCCVTRMLKASGRSTSGGVVKLGGGVLSCWAKKPQSVALSCWESELFSAITIRWAFRVT